MKGRQKMGQIWTSENRRILESLLQEGYTIPWISKNMGISPTAIYSEIKRTIEEDEYEARRYIKYTAKKAMEKDIMRIKGELNDE